MGHKGSLFLRYLFLLGGGRVFGSKFTRLIVRPGYTRVFLAIDIMTQKSHAIWRRVGV
jgi:hypothetical protein